MRRIVLSVLFATLATAAFGQSYQSPVYQDLHLRGAAIRNSYTITELKGLSVGGIAAGARVSTSGYASAGDGGEADYVFSTTSCSLNSGAGDNGSQVKPTTGTGCWLAQFNSKTDLRQWGAQAGQNIDAPLDKAITWACSTHKPIELPFVNGSPYLVAIQHTFGNGSQSSLSTCNDVHLEVTGEHWEASSGTTPPMTKAFRFTGTSGVIPFVAKGPAAGIWFKGLSVDCNGVCGTAIKIDNIMNGVFDGLTVEKHVGAPGIILTTTQTNTWFGALEGSRFDNFMVVVPGAGASGVQVGDTGATCDRPVIANTFNNWTVNWDSTNTNAYGVQIACASQDTFINYRAAYDPVRGGTSGKAIKIVAPSSAKNYPTDITFVHPLVQGAVDPGPDATGWTPSAGGFHFIGWSSVYGGFPAATVDGRFTGTDSTGTTFGNVAVMTAGGQIKFNDATGLYSFGSAGHAIWSLSSSFNIGNFTNSIINLYGAGGLVANSVLNVGTLNADTIHQDRVTVDHSTPLTASDRTTYAAGFANSGGSTDDVTIGSDASNGYIQSWAGKPLQLNSQGNEVIVGAGGLRSPNGKANFTSGTGLHSFGTADGAQNAAGGILLHGPSSLGNQGGTGLYNANTNAGATTGAFNIAQMSSTGSWQNTLALYDYPGQYWQFNTNGAITMRMNPSHSTDFFGSVTIPDGFGFAWGNSYLNGANAGAVNVITNGGVTATFGADHTTTFSNSLHMTGGTGVTWQSSYINGNDNAEINVVNNGGVTATFNADHTANFTGAIQGTQFNVTDNAYPITAASTGAYGPQVRLQSRTSDGTSPYLIFDKGRGTSATTTLANDIFGSLTWYGRDLANAQAYAASQYVVQSGAAGASSITSDLHFGMANVADPLVLHGADGSATFGGGIGVSSYATIGGTITAQAQSGGWASTNVGKELLVTTTGGANNPAIGISDYTGSNWLGIINSSGTLQFASMPPPSNSSTAPSVAMEISSGQVTFKKPPMLTFNFPELRLMNADALHGWRWTSTGSGSSPGVMVLQSSNDNFASATDNLSVSSGGGVTAGSPFALTASNQATYGLTVGNAGANDLSLGVSPSDTYIQSFNGKALQLNAIANKTVVGPDGIQLSSKTVSGLPTCNTAARGMVFWVTDASAPAWNATLAGGGAVGAEAICNGANWTAH